LRCIKKVRNLFNEDEIVKVRDFKNLDRLFQENLKDYEVAPPKKSWNAIEKRLKNDSRKRIVPFWLKLSSIAALLVLFFTVGTIFFIPQNSITDSFLLKKSNSSESTDTNETKSTIIVSPERNATKNLDKGVIIPLKKIEESSNSIANSNEQQSNSSEESNFKQESLNRFALTDTKNLPFSKKNKDVKNIINTESRFTVATIFAPIYFNSFGSGSGPDAQFNENQTSGGSSYSYGVKFAYKLNRKFSVQSGVNMINLGQTTNDVYITPGIAVVSLSNISNAPIGAKSNSNLSKQDIALANENAGSLNQTFGYVEIPVEIKYNVADGKIGVNIVGGFSTLLLNKDEVFIETNSFSQSLGNSNNLRDINFSGNFGIDVDYSIYKDLFINVSPMFKVQTNTFSTNSGNVQSYYLGVYTGINYKF